MDRFEVCDECGYKISKTNTDEAKFFNGVWHRADCPVLERYYKRQHAQDALAYAWNRFYS